MQILFYEHLCFKYFDIEDEMNILLFVHVYNILLESISYSEIA